MATVIDISRVLSRHPTRKYKIRKISDIRRVVIHTANWATTPEVLAKYDITPYFEKNGIKYWNHISKRGCPAITYSEIIMPGGECFHTLPWEEVAWHVGPWNKSSLGLALMYECTNEFGIDCFAPPEKMLKTLYLRCSNILFKLGLPPTRDHLCGHRELRWTGWFWSKGSKKLRKTCPGLEIDLDDVRKNVAKYMQLVLKAKKLYMDRIDGIWGVKSQYGLDKYLIKD
jgi:hypothetical protein